MKKSEWIFLKLFLCCSRSILSFWFLFDRGAFCEFVSVCTHSLLLCDFIQHDLIPLEVSNICITLSNFNKTFLFFSFVLWIFFMLILFLFALFSSNHCRLLFRIWNIIFYYVWNYNETKKATWNMAFACLNRSHIFKHLHAWNANKYFITYQ